MKSRLLTALIGVPIAIAWLFSLYVPVVFSAVLAVVGLIAEFEMLRVFEVKNIAFKVLCLATSAGVIFMADYNKYLNIPLFPIIAAIVIVSLIIMVLDFENLKFEQVVCSLFCALLTSEALACVILFRDCYLTWPEKFVKADGVFFILLAFFSSWISDGCALFAGRLFGKHKLAEKISPKKTVEGAIGGLAGNVIFCIALFFIMNKFFGLGENITLLFTVISSAVLSIISIFGDLAASTIKRHHGIKDFGNLLPGHGGIMDRFDSSVFVFAALYSTVAVIGNF